MRVRGGSRSIALLVVALVAAAGCGDSESEGTKPIAAPGVVTAPRQPIIVKDLPEGWLVEQAEFPGFTGGDVHTLYLAPGSTPELGPALAIGRYGEDSGTTLCGRGHEADVGLDGAATGAFLSTSGDLMVVETQVNPDEESYVLSRDLSEAQLFAAARASKFSNQEAPAEISVDGLPDGFRKVAAAPVTPGASFGETINLTHPDLGSLRINAYDGDPAADLLTQFWRATVEREPCAYSEKYVRSSRVIEGNDVLLWGNTSQKVADEIAANITVTDQSGFDAFRDKVNELPASNLLSGCGDGGVVIEGTKNGVRWVIGMTAGMTKPAMSCSTFVIDGEVQPGGVFSGGGPTFQYPGTYNITVLASSFSGLPDGRSLGVFGGTVPAAATRVVISDGNGTTTNATLVKGGADPDRRFFGGMLAAPSLNAGAMRITILAYDAAGKEIGHFSPPPL